MRRLRLLAMDVRIDILVADPSLARLLTGLLGDLAPPVRPGPAGALVVVAGSGPWQVSSPGHSTTVTTLPAVTSAVLAAVNLTAVQSTRLLAVHAAVLTRGDRVLVLPAPSGTGKSTLTACLLARGWSYVSDEALCLRWEDGSVVPYPRPMGLSAWSASVAGVEGVRGHDGTTPERLVTVTGERWSVDPSPGPVTEVVLLSRRDGAPVLVEAARQDVVVELLRRSFTHFLDPARALGLLSAVVNGARCHQLRLGEPRSAATLLDRQEARPRQGRAS